MSTKLDYVCYDVRGPVLEEAERMRSQGLDILSLNIGNPAPFGFEAPGEIIHKMTENLHKAEGYSDSKGILSAREAIVNYCEFKKIPNVSVNDVYTGNGVSELILMAMQGLLTTEMRSSFPHQTIRCGRRLLRWQGEKLSITSAMSSTNGILISRISAVK